MAKILGQIPGAMDVQVQSPPGTPQLVVKLRPQALARWVFDRVSVLDAIRTAYQGDQVGQVYDGNRVFDVSMILAPRERKSAESVGNLLVRSSVGTYAPLEELVDIYEDADRYVILHDGARRVQTVTANVRGGNVASFVDAAKRQIAAKVSLPPDSYVESSEAALRGVQERLSPILMTALVTALGLPPLAIGNGAPGCEIEGPMAIVILGGLFTSTALNLLVLSMLALRLGRFEQEPTPQNGAT